jgi:adenylate kinase
VQDVMARGALCPDDIVVGIVEQRIAEPDASKGFILDGFPRTVPQAEALDTMLSRHGIALDAVIELKVDETALIRRIETRVAEMQARGEPLRPDDNPDVLHRRLVAYREQTAPLIAYYRAHGILHSVNGMAPIDAVAGRIEEILSDEPAAETTKKPAAKAARAATRSRRSAAPASKTAIGKKSKTRPPSRRKPSAASRKRVSGKTKVKAKIRPKTKAKAKSRAKAKAVKRRR